MNVENRPAPRAVFVVGILAQPDRDVARPLQLMDDQFGPRYLDAEPYDFDFTDYYHEEHGAPLSRRWSVYESLFDPEQLPSRKRTAMSIEDRFTDGDENRYFNVDVGYVTGSSFVLASRKNHSHRIYLGQGIYGEVTLRYEQGEWREGPHTYPEFSSPGQVEWLDDAREWWLSQDTE